MAFLQAALAVAPLIGKIFGGAAKGSADQRMAENNQQAMTAQINNRDALDRALLQSNNQNTRATLQNADNQYRAGLDLQRKTFQQQEGSAQARQALAGSLLQRIQALPSGVSGVIDAIGPEAREAGGLLAQRGVSGLRKGPTQFADLPAVSLPDLVNLPPAQMAEMQKSGLLEKILGGLGVAGSVVGALGDLKSVTPKSGNNLPIDEFGGG